MKTQTTFIQRCIFVVEYIAGDILGQSKQKAKDALKTSNLFVESPYHSYASIICWQRIQQN